MSGSLWVQVGHDPGAWWLRADQVIGFKMFDLSANTTDAPRIYVDVCWAKGDRVSEETVVDGLSSKPAGKILIQELIDALAKHRDDTGVLVVQNGRVKFIATPQILP
ncbi:hypothetical protein [Nocardia sp. NPDC004722]